MVTEAVHPRMRLLEVEPNHAAGMRTIILTALAAFLNSFLLSAQAMRPARLAARVPFVGCPSDGQLGPRKAPAGKAMAFSISANEAQQLAFYQSESEGVLAPRGWHCIGGVGSSGDFLYVSPQPIDERSLTSMTWEGFSGPAIELAHYYGDTSGRDEVARIIMRALPAHRALVGKLLQDGVESGLLPSGPYPTDRLIAKRENIVEFQTPAHTRGLGTNSRLQANGDPIRGTAILAGKTPDAILLSVRLSPSNDGLSPAIIQQMENDVSARNTQ
jgi:hypothetical protein